MNLVKLAKALEVPAKQLLDFDMEGDNGQQ
jgi:hypothetical protein